MDYHFTIPRDEVSLKPSANSSALRFVKKLTPIFLLSALLPLFLIIVSSPTDLKFLTRADQDASLRIWYEPSQIVASPGREIKLKVFAEFMSESSLMPGVSFKPYSDEVVVEGEISYLKPFKGMTQLGEIKIVAPESGNYELTIPSESVFLAAYSDPIEIITGSAQIYVR